MKESTGIVLSLLAALAIPACGRDDSDHGSAEAGGGGSAPVVLSLAQPRPGDSFEAPASVTLVATATEPMAQVMFLQNGSTLGSTAEEPYTLEWSPVPAGTYVLTASGTDRNGGTHLSQSVTITVVDGASAGPRGWNETAHLGHILRGVWFIDASRGWVVGTEGRLHATTDGGATWTLQPSDTREHLNQVQFVDLLYGWIVGDRGTLLRTENGGSSWERQEIDPGVNFKGLSFIDSQRGWVVGEEGAFKTDDGGVTWRPIPAAGHAVQFVDAARGWVLGEAAAPDGDLRHTVLRTHDGGHSWTELFRTDAHNKRLPAMDFVSASTGWVSTTSGQVDFDRGIKATGDGGNTWTLQSTPAQAGIYALDFLSSGLGWGVGSRGVIIHTQDGGAAWHLQRSAEPTGNPSFIDVHFVDGTTGWAVREDGAVFKTTTGGR